MSEEILWSLAKIIFLLKQYKEEIVLGIYDEHYKEYYSYFKIKKANEKQLQELEIKFSDLTQNCFGNYNKYITNPISPQSDICEYLSNELIRIFNELNIEIEYRYMPDNVYNIPDIILQPKEEECQHILKVPGLGLFYCSNDFNNTGI